MINPLIYLTYIMQYVTEKLFAHTYELYHKYQ